MSKKLPWPCKLKKGRISPCHGLAAVLQPCFGRGTRQQGVEMHSMINMETHKFSRHVVVIKSGDEAKKGVVMNVCPFCATKLREGFNAAAK